MDCPSCGGDMLRRPNPDAREVVRQMVQTGSNAPYAQYFAEEQARKETEKGAILHCTACDYMTRENDAPAADRRSSH